METSYLLSYFLKSTQNEVSKLKYVYVRIKVNGEPKETSTKQRWDITRWDQKKERAKDNREDARQFNEYLDNLSLKVAQHRNNLLAKGDTITAQALIDCLKGKTPANSKVLAEFHEHNEEIAALVKKGEYAGSTHTRYQTALSHVKDFIAFKYQADDLEFKQLNYVFVKDYEFYLKTVRNCSNNTTLKYISNFKKIVLRAVAKEILLSDPFKQFKGKKTKIKKWPLTKWELAKLESHAFASERLSVVRDVFLFQCYTGLAYIDAYKLTLAEIQTGFDGKLWIISQRKKSDSLIRIPLLPQALSLLEKYKTHPVCLARGSALPVRSNQKMNEYLKEIADLCGITCKLNTHTARRTFASTVTLGNEVPIHVVKEMLGHYSVKQTEEYTMVEEEAIGRNMENLEKRLSNRDAQDEKTLLLAKIQELENQINALKGQIELRATA